MQEKQEHDGLKVIVKANGSLKIFGNFELTLADGTVQQMDQAAFCRCGLSLKMPFCDGEHRRVGWVEPESEQ